MEEPIRNLKDLGITDEDLIDIIIEDTDDGGATFQYVYTDEATSIIVAYCERMGIVWEDLLRAFLFGLPHPPLNKR